MSYITQMESPLGKLTLAADEQGLSGVWFADQKYYGSTLPKDAPYEEVPLLAKTKRWLKDYFAGEKPKELLPLHLQGTDFQKKVWRILCTIPYGETRTYGEIAGLLAQQEPGKRVSAQAVGGAVGRNPISIIVPCHRVVGSKGTLVGYAGGLERKQALLDLEQLGKAIPFQR